MSLHVKHAECLVLRVMVMCKSLVIGGKGVHTGRKSEQMVGCCGEVSWIQSPDTALYGVEAISFLVSTISQTLTNAVR